MACIFVQEAKKNVKEYTSILALIKFKDGSVYQSMDDWLEEDQV